MNPNPQDFNNSKPGNSNPDVFIAYSHDSEQHKKSVLELANRLVGDGINCHLDQYETSPPEGWPEWCRRKIAESNYVLVVCTQTYLRRISGKEQFGIGRGAKWEGVIITQTIYNADSKNYKFIPVILNSSDQSLIPDFLSGATRYDLSLSDGYEKLYRHVTEQPSIIKPTLGKIKHMPPDSQTTDRLLKGEPPALVTQLKGYSPDATWAYLRWKIKLPVINPGVKLSISNQQSLIDNFHKLKGERNSYIRRLFPASDINGARKKHILKAESNENVTNYRERIQLEISDTAILSVSEYAGVNCETLLKIKDVTWRLYWLFLLARQAASQAKSNSINMEMEIISYPNSIRLNKAIDDPLEDDRVGFGQNEKVIRIERRFNISEDGEAKDVELWLLQLIQAIYEHYPYKSGNQWRVPKVDKEKLGQIVKDKFER